MIKEILESIKNIKPGYQILVNGKWFVVDEIDGDIIWASDNDGKEYEFKIKDIEAVEESLIEKVLTKYFEEKIQKN